MANTWFTSDLHWGHKNILKFCEKTRPFSTLTEMNDHLINHWRNTVAHDDDVWILGDVFFTRADQANHILEQLPGIKHLVLGNHDNVIQSSNEVKSHFASIDTYKELKFGRQDVVLFHYPIVEFNKMHYGSWHLYGHVHGSFTHPGKALDVGWDGPIGQKLISLNDIKEYMADRPILTHHATGQPNEKILERT